VTGFVSKAFLEPVYMMKCAVTLEEEAAYLAEQARIARDNATAQAIYASAATGGCTRNPVILSYDDAYLIGCVCEMEAGYVDYSIRLAIANIIINRYLSGIWGYSIPGVVYAPGQFNGASTAYTPSASTMQAVYDALAGHNNAGGYMYYCTIPAMERVNHGPGTILGPMFMYEPGWL